MATINLTKGGFERRIADTKTVQNNWHFLGNKPAVIDFYASWCGPCKRLLPILEELSTEYADKIDIYKVNVDEERELSALFGIRSIPTLLFIPMTGEPHKITGAMIKSELHKLIDEHLLSH